MSYGLAITGADGTTLTVTENAKVCEPLFSSLHLIYATRKISPSNPTYSYVSCSETIQVPGYDPLIHTLAYSVNAFTTESGHSSVWFTSYAAFSITTSGNSITLYYRSPSSGNASRYDSARYPYTKVFHLLIEVFPK